MIRSKNDTKDLLLSITKNCQTPIKKTHREAQETLEFSFKKPTKTSHFNPPIRIKGDRMLGLTGLEVYNSYFNINTTNNNFELYTDNSDEF